MPLEILDDIRAAEEKARETARNASLMAHEIAVSTQEADAESLKQSQAQLNQDISAFLKTQADKTAADISAKAREYDLALDKMSDEARKRLPQASALIFERIIR